MTSVTRRERGAARPSSPAGGAAAYARKALAAARVKAEFGDLLLALYVLAFARQYLWVIDDNLLAWCLAAPLAALVLALYVSTKPLPAGGFGAPFWLAVALPLLLVYSLRLPFPDISFDVLNYRLLHAERSLRGTLFAPGDFFPTPVPANPAPDTITGLFRHALGYRLGTVVNLLALVWAAQVVDRLLRPFVARAWPRAACVLLAVLAEHLLFEVNNYMVDLLALPLLLEATRLALRAEEAERPRAVFVHAALLLGLSVALKLTNAAAVVTVGLLCAYKALAGPARLKLKGLPATLGLSFVAFAAPLAPFAAYLWSLTGNPLFPLANGFFESPYWPTAGGWDRRWGPHGFLETLVWPVLAWLEPARHSELNVYSGRVALGFVVALGGLLLARRDPRVRTLCLVLLVGCLAWSAGGMGYSRYGLYLELLSGLTVVAVASSLLKARQPGTAAPALTGAAALLFAALCAQAAAACVYAFGHEWSMRPTAVSSWRSYRYEARYIFRDRRLPDFFDDRTRSLLGGVGTWVESCPKSNGFAALVAPGAPAVTVKHHEYFATRAGRGRFVRAVMSAPAPLLSLCLPEDLSQGKALVESRGLAVGRVVPVELPFFSQRRRIGMMLVEVLRPEGGEGGGAFEALWKSAPFPDRDYRAQITTADAPRTMRAGGRATLRFRVRNTGGSTWPSRGDAKGMYQVNLGDRWLDASGTRVVNNLDGRTALAADLPPGAEAEMTLPVTAPKEPGDYVLEIDMIHEGVTFFFEKGSPTLRLNVRVGP